MVVQSMRRGNGPLAGPAIQFWGSPGTCLLSSTRPYRVEKDRALRGLAKECRARCQVSNSRYPDVQHPLTVSESHLLGKWGNRPVETEM